jgi:hypothetical protein
LDSEGDREPQPGMKARNLLQQASDAGSGDLRLVYLQEAQREIAKLDPARHGRIISQLQSAALALQGRRGDTQIAHVTPGEIVIPLAVLTPDLRRSLAAAVRDAGIDPRSLVIGDAHNSTNPQTGRPEFAFRNLDNERTGQRSAPPGQQVADLYITRFPEAAGGLGHVGVGVNTEKTEGFFPRENSWLAGIATPGEVRSDDLSLPHDTLRIRTTPEQDAAAQSYIDNRKANPGDYGALTRQCTGFVDGALNAAGVEVPSDSTEDIYDDLIPNRFFPALKRRYGP